MWWVDLVVYSDRKVALELDLYKGRYVLPRFSTDDISKKNIINRVKDTLNIEIELFEVLKRDKDSLFILIGEWEGKLNIKSPSKRTIWYKIRDAIEKIEDSGSKETLTFFKKKYREVVLESDRTVGIADIGECEKYKLTTREAKVFIKNEKGEIMVDKENGNYNSLSTYLELGESPEEAAYRLLSTKYGFLTELRNINLIREYSKDKRVNSHILVGNYDGSLTFSSEMANNCHFMALNHTSNNHQNDNYVLSDELRSTLFALEGKI